MPPDAAPRSICLVRLSALGDVVMVLPLVRALQSRWPGVRITWVIGRAAHEAVAGLAAEGIEFVVIDKPRRISDYRALWRALKGRRFDALLCLQASWRANLIYPGIAATRKIGYGRDRAKDLHRLFVRETLPDSPPHIVDGFFQFAEALGISRPPAADWRLPVDPAADAWCERTLPASPFVAVSACASKPERDWPLDRWAELVRRVHGRWGLPVVLFGGPGDREIAAAREIVARSGVDALDLVGRTRIPQLVAALGRCRLLVAPDTGAVHIANALARPVVGLYAVAPSSRTGPYGNLDTCVDVFGRAIRELQGRDPASVPWSHRVHDPRAMQLITVDEVFTKIDLILGRGET